jgi:hypothetical protein
MDLSGAEDMVMRLQEVLVFDGVTTKIVNDEKIIYIIALVVLTISSSCTKDFEEINTNSNAQNPFSQAFFHVK